MRICVFPGTFDPITLGHTDVIDRALDLFDELIIAIGVNASKVPMFPLEQRLQWIRDIYRHEPRIKAAAYEGLTVDFCKKMQARFILRGIRYVSDFEYEKAIADVNRAMDNSLETIFLTCTPQYTSIASTLVRDIIRNKGDVSQFLPAEVLRTINNE
ncbi:pantetheine-phosphate adenylyltransferase [Chitinophaga japonensis]|uniref:Phosphopantetheine adenylyltransferase n=1 Tax=Chitinophaga japonensis TaxID=104662 RepID=A0A562SSU8_CHIJA|nr:pantetheine-phosphate adenylyltransferase [Chitinophaga japonensis]TWI84325.1 phosphopantetheine adenylyltransferase [Chitinophaga japonensis]